MIIDNDTPRCQQWIKERTGGVGTDLVVAIGLEKHGELKAVTGYNLFEGNSCFVHFCIDKGTYPDRKYIWFVHYYPFVQCGLDVMIALVSSANAAILRLCEHLGYKEKYRLDDCNRVLLTLNKTDCKWLSYGFQ